jgi:hypothetical protein
MAAGHKDLPDLLADFTPVARACDRGPHFYQLIDSDAHLIVATFLLIPDTTLPLLAVGWTLVHELYFYLVFWIFLALRIPIWAGVIGWGVILLLIVTAFPDQLAVVPLLHVATSPFDSRIYDGIDGRSSLDEALGGGRDLGRRPRTRRPDAVDRLSSADIVTFDQPTSRRLARCDIWYSVGAGRIHDHWFRTAARIIATQDLNGGAWRLVVLHLPRPCAGYLGRRADAVSFCPKRRS